MSTVSVIIPTYNCEKYILQAIDSVLKQYCENVEIIVIDDGSTDNTQQAIKYLIEGCKIKYIYQENSGPSTARNNGISNSNGELITFLDADDILLVGFFELITSYMNRNQHVDFLFTNYDIFDENGIVSPSGVDTWKIFRSIPHSEGINGDWVFTDELTAYIIKHGSFMHTSGLTIRRSALNNSGNFIEGHYYGEDDEFYARVTYGRVSGYINCVLSRKRNHKASIIHDNKNVLRNTKGYLELTEYQKIYYCNNRNILNVLDEKVIKLACDYSWGLQAQGYFDESHKTILLYLKKKWSWPLFKILIKNYLMRLDLLSVYTKWK